MARSLALSLPEAVEQDHHGRPSFRIAGKIFATLRDEGRMNVMLDEGGILTAVEDAPDLCEAVYWGKRLAAVAVDLDRAEPAFLADLLRDAWETKAPQRCSAAEERILSALPDQERAPMWIDFPDSYGMYTTGGDQDVKDLLDRLTNTIETEQPPRETFVARLREGLQQIAQTNSELLQSYSDSGPIRDAVVKALQPLFENRVWSPLQESEIRI
jgi:hypothetical protein